MLWLAATSDMGPTIGLLGLLGIGAFALVRVLTNLVDVERRAGGSLEAASGFSLLWTVLAALIGLRLLEDGAVAADPASARLHKALAHSAQEVEEVLSKLVTVRVQLGLVALAGDTAPVRCHLGELASRARALEEFAC